MKLTKLLGLLAAHCLAPLASGAEPEPGMPALRLAQAQGAQAEESAAGSGGGGRSNLRWGADPLIAEVGTFSDSPRADSQATWRSRLFLAWQPDRRWELRFGARLEGDVQSGPGEVKRGRIALGDSYARLRAGDARLTLGMQTIVWGRVDAVPIIDRVSRTDLRRYAMDDLADRRLPQPALRWEHTLGDFKLDAVLLPSYRGVRLPAAESVWHPVDRTTGRIIGIDAGPELSALVRATTLRQDEEGKGGAAVRLTRSAEPIDFGLTVARTRQPLPWFRLDPVRRTLTAEQPLNTFVGADFEVVVAESYTFRSELGWTGDVAATSPLGQLERVRSVDWIGGVEMFPAGKNTRVNLQLVAHRLRTDRQILELREYYGVNGEVETTFDRGRWKAGLRFASGLNLHDTYLAPKLSVLGWEPHELYVTVRHFDGEEKAYNGFYRDNKMLAIGLKTRF